MLLLPCMSQWVENVYKSCNAEKIHDFPVLGFISLEMETP